MNPKKELLWSPRVYAPIPTPIITASLFISTKQDFQSPGGAFLRQVTKLTNKSHVCRPLAN